eukprot:9032666-Alexandrium_andersonii.AAC.1
MSASLVGSEMCIRDRTRCGCRAAGRHPEHEQAEHGTRATDTPSMRSRMVGRRRAEPDGSACGTMR